MKVVGLHCDGYEKSLKGAVQDRLPQRTDREPQGQTKKHEISHLGKQTGSVQSKSGIAVNPRRPGS